MTTVNKILTSIPILDELVYYTKIMVYDTIIKDSDEADSYETLESITKSDLYLACISGRAKFAMFDYTLEMIIEVDLQPIDIREDCVHDKSLIPIRYRDALTALAVQDYIANYVELNDYYRMLNGIPEYKDTGVYPSTMNQLLAPGIYIKDYSGLPEDIDLTIPLHKYDSSIIDLLKDNGVINQVKSDYPTKKYLNYLGNKKISIYSSRSAESFSILYVPKIEINEVYQNFRTIIEKNRVYVMKVVYNTAFKLGSDYYNKFIIILILIQSFVDMLINAPDYLIRRDIFDIRTVQYIFESYGVEYYKEIPLKYQIALVKNLNKLLKYKSTTKNLVDICKLFGFDDISIFKYYILKDRKVDENGDFIFEYKEIDDPDHPGQTILVDDDEKNYELKFFSAPIDGDMDMYIRDTMNYTPYDDITTQDKYWDGDKTHEQVKKELLNYEFNVLQSKYISIDSVYHLTNLSFERPYFFSILFEKDRRADGVKMSIPYITSTKMFKFTDVICFLYSLMYEYYGIKDEIIDTTTKIMSVKGFNFQADMTALSNYLIANGTTLEKMGVSNFQIPTGTLLTFGQIVDIFTKNEEIYYHIEDQMYKANSYKIYNIYKTIYESLMIHNENLDFFKKSDDTIATSYLDFLSDRDIMLHDIIVDIKNISTPDEKTVALINMVNFTIQALEEYIDTDKYKHLFSNMPTESATAIQKYIYKVINFFKSYKIDILAINNIYKLDDEANKVNILDKIFFNSTFDKNDIINTRDTKPRTQVNTLKNDSVLITDEIEKYVLIKRNDTVSINQTVVDFQSNIYELDALFIDEVFTPSVSNSKTDNVNTLDKLWFTRKYISYWSANSAVLNTARSGLAGCGYQLSGLSFGGGNDNILNNTELFNGSTWVNSGVLNTARKWLAGCGLQNAGLSFGGFTTINADNTELFNGSAWSNSGVLNTARRTLAGCGLQNAGLSFGGYITGQVNNTEKFNGSVWSNSGNLNSIRSSLAGCGSMNAALSFGGTYSTTLSVTEKFNNTVWSITGNLNTARSRLAGCGLQNAGLSFGGNNVITIASTELFNGNFWTNGGNMINSKEYLAGCGVQTAGLSFGGSNGTYSNATEMYNEVTI